MTFKSIPFVITFAIIIQSSAFGQQLPAPDEPALRADAAPRMRSLPAASAFHADSIGLPPADPLAVELYRADPKLVVGFDVNPLFGLEATFVNPLHREGLTYLGSGPRLAQGVPLNFSGPRPSPGAPHGVGGFDLDLAARLTVPLDERWHAFGKLGATVSQRKYGTTSGTEIAPAASVGATYKLDNGQTLTAEAPLGALARKALSGVSGAGGARVKLGF